MTPHKDQERLNQIWQEYKETKNESAREALVEQYIPLVKYVAGRLAINLPSSVDVGDLEGFGFFGLLDAMEKFDHTRNIKFETYASLRIRGAIIDGLRSMDWVPRSTRSKARELENAVYELTNQLGRNPSDGEIAAALDLPRERYYDLLDEVRGVGLFSLDETLAAQDADDNLRMMDLVSTEEQSPAEILLHSETVEELAEAVQGLTEREQLVLSLYYTDELTLKEIGHILEVSESRVSQIHTRVIMTLRGKFKESTERRG
ncbi:MAG TPA: FliA/WhiG family RNA polymerase sigma factor [Firmicutes bacterium]|nr:FliA/WhiG family RNA polymerase sigma factor [Bacillota bacterium]